MVTFSHRMLRIAPVALGLILTSSAFAQTTAPRTATPARPTQYGYGAYATPAPAYGYAQGYAAQGYVGQGYAAQGYAGQGYLGQGYVDPSYGAPAYGPTQGYFPGNMNGYGQADAWSAPSYGYAGYAAAPGQNYGGSQGPAWTPGLADGRFGEPSFYLPGYAGFGGGVEYPRGSVPADPYLYHFGPGYYRNQEAGHYRFPYYSYRRPWYFPGHPSYNRDTNIPW